MSNTLKNLSESLKKNMKKLEGGPLTPGESKAEQVIALGCHFQYPLSHFEGWEQAEAS